MRDNSVQLTGNARCPSCEKLLDGATAIDGAKVYPKPDDPSVCFYCGATLRYTEAKTWELASPEYLASLDNETASSVAAAAIAVKSYRTRGEA